MALLRPTGLSVLGDMPWGAHFCLFYQTKHDLLSTVVPYFKAGIENREHCIWVLSKSDPITKEDAQNALGRAVDLTQHSLSGSVEILSHEEWFLQSHRFDVEVTVARLRDKLDQALRHGKAGVRLNGGTAWLQADWDNFHAFEGALDATIADRPAIALCNFPLAHTAAANMLDAVDTHHFGLTIRNSHWANVQLSDPPAISRRLTPRELEVLKWVAKGKSAPEIGMILHITERTVNEHVKNACEKLGAKNRTQAVVRALLAHIIDV